MQQPGAHAAKDKAAAARATAGKLKKDNAPVVSTGDNKLPKIIIKQGGQAMAPSEKRAAPPPPVPLTAAQESATQELRKGLWTAVERWLAARALLPGEGQDKFKSELKRLCQLIVFDEYRASTHDDQKCFDEQLGEQRDNGSMRRETTFTRFGFRVPANHPRPPPPVLFQSTTHIFSADSIMGKTRNGLKDMRWKIEMEVSGLFSLSFHTQSMEVYEDIEADMLEQLKTTLSTELTLSELGVLLMIAGLCCRGAAAWVDVQDICFWSHNFTLPELQLAQTASVL